MTHGHGSGGGGGGGDGVAPVQSPAAVATATATTKLVDERAALTSRIIPRMTLSTASNPLTAPLPPIATSPSSSPSAAAAAAAEKARQRFAIEGNAVLTGGAGAIGLAAARALLEHGASGICLMDLPATLESSASSINALKSSFAGAGIHTMAVDVTSAEAVDAAFAQAVSQMGRIDMLCCFAGIVSTVPSISVTAQQFQKVIDVNLTGSFLCAQAAARYMMQSLDQAHGRGEKEEEKEKEEKEKEEKEKEEKEKEEKEKEEKRGGCILFTASISAHATNFPQPQVAYNTSKAAVRQLTKNLAAEWAVHGIRVNCLAPGYMDTVLNAGDNLKEVRDIWASRCPMGRMGDVEEITGPVVLLCSKRAGRYMTGSELLVDGGALCF